MRSLICFAWWMVLLSVLTTPAFVHGQDFQPDSPQERGRGGRDGNRVYKQRVSPNWIGSSDQFWYRNDLPNGQREFILVDPQKGTRLFAFDHAAVAKAMGDIASASKLPIERLEFNETDHTVLLIGPRGGKSYRWNPDTSELTESPLPVAVQEGTAGNGNRPRGRATGQDSSITFENRSDGAVEIFWLSGDEKQSYGKIEKGATRDQHTFGGHRWQIVNAKGEVLGEVTAEDEPTRIAIDGKPIPSRPRAGSRRPSPREARAQEFASPDKKWNATIENNNIIVVNNDSDERIVFSQDGSAEEPYGQLLWSPDSSTLIAFRQKEVLKLPVHWIRSSPPGGGRAQLEVRPYSLPGDPFPTYELNLFRISDRKQIKPPVDRFEHEWLRPRVRFSKDGSTFSYEQTDRGHGRFRLIEVKIADGSVRNIIDEKTDTFIWTAHTENQQLQPVQWLENGTEIIYVTEKYGWRQAILVDAISGEEKRRLTPEGIVLRGIDAIDEPSRKLWFQASGRDGQDPYLIHYGYVSLDDGKLVWLTEGNGNHSIQFSPSKQYIIDTYSRVDLAPVNELRRVSDGSLVCKLETSDITELEASGWKPPEVFSAKGRDGKTDIWGIICRPKDFDPKKRYPVIEDIYAGPQGSFVPKTFSPAFRYESLTQLGFIVVKIDGMGTANRSKAFHDVCWKNLKDGGFQDRILWMKEAAKSRPEMDLDRVGIYGTSAGGQNAAGAVLFHPEFYKVAVAACGCHDNRMDKASWNEQWMGYPVGPHYAECSNVDNAHRLQGKLFLIVGEMDTNVPPESTMRVADALIRANKDFDLLVVPNGGHGMGGAYGNRRMHEFFVRHLLENPPPAVSAQSLSSRTSNRIDPVTVLKSQETKLAKATVPDPKIDNIKVPQVSLPPDSFFDLVRERHREKARSFYKKYLDVDGLPVVAAEEVVDEALIRTHDIVSHMLAGRPDVLQSMQRNGMYLIIIGKNQLYTDMPEYSDHPNPTFQNERVRGTGGKPTSFGEENLIGYSLDRYDDESIGVHEFCHTIDSALRSMDPTWSDRLKATYQSAMDQGLYKYAYASTNAGEYWAEICQAYFDCNRVNNWNHGPIGTREQLKSYDPKGYELVRETFRLSETQNWRYTFPRSLPAVETPPTKLQIPLYYTKFCWAREMPVIGKEASDESLLLANNIVRRLFAYRHDVLKALLAANVQIVVLGKGESLGQLPEVQSAVKQGAKVDLLSRYLPYTPEVKRIVVSEENLSETRATGAAANSHLVELLADAIYKIAIDRPVDPDWESRPRGIWQQYELRLERFDNRMRSSLESLHAKHVQQKKWLGTQACHGPRELWIYGVLAYFHAVGQSPCPNDSKYAILTREDLAAYDPELYAFIAKSMAYEEHVDWRLR
ncbi:MAG: prolyl oligopeptidase family serine peptidase [Pirellula sp.]|nr:prolyl oligopeptidase family serine peptidase [Pirellula sp.]